MNKRDFLGIMLAAAAAPAIVRAESIMQIVVPRPLILWGDGVHDDTAALQTFFDGGLVVRPNGADVGRIAEGGTYLLTRTVMIDNQHDAQRTLINSYIIGRTDISPMFMSSEPLLLSPVSQCALITRPATR